MPQFCIYCGAPLAEEGDYCPACGKNRRAAPDADGAAAKPLVLPPEAERTFFQDGIITVTNIRFVVPGRVFPMSEVKSVRVERRESTGSWPTVLYLLALGALFARLYRFGFLLLLLATIIKLLFRPKYAVMLDTVSGAVSAFASGDRDYIVQVVEAVKQALVYR